MPCEKGRGSRQVIILVMCHALVRLTMYQVKGKIAKDPRYDAVGSSSLREELYNTFIKAQDSVAPPAQMDAVDNDASAQEDKMTKQERRERAVRDREAQVHVERRKVEADIDRSKLNLNREEGEALFRCAGSSAEELLGADYGVSWPAQCLQMRSETHRYDRAPESTALLTLLIDDVG
jgi:hypothetical protein